MTIPKPEYVRVGVNDTKMYLVKDVRAWANHQADELEKLNDYGVYSTIIERVKSNLREVGGEK